MRQLAKWIAAFLILMIVAVGLHHFMRWAHTRYTYDYFFPYVQQVWLGIQEYREQHGKQYPSSITDPDVQSRLPDKVRQELPKYPVLYFPPKTNSPSDMILLARETPYGFIVSTIEGSRFVTNELRIMDSGNLGEDQSEE